MKSLIFKILSVVVLVFCMTGSLLAQDMADQGVSLSIKQKSIIPIAANAAIGELQQLQTALNKGLDAGLTVNEIKEVMVHLYAYCGFPRSIRGLQTFMEVLDARKENEIMDENGREATPVITEVSKYERGKMNLEKLTGMPQSDTKSGYASFAPVIEVFLKEHLFADIFDRDVLTYTEREIVTISVITAIGSAEPMLRNHLAICLNLGLTPQQLSEFVNIIKSTLGKKEAKAAQTALNEVLSNR